MAIRSPEQRVKRLLGEADERHARVDRGAGNFRTITLRAQKLKEAEEKAHNIFKKQAQDAREQRALQKARELGLIDEPPRPNTAPGRQQGGLRMAGT